MCDSGMLSVFVSVSLCVYICLLISCLKIKLLTYTNFKTLCLKVEPCSSSVCLFAPHCYNFFFFFFPQEYLAWQTLAVVSVLNSSEVAQKEIHEVAPTLCPLLQTPVERPLKSYMTLKHSIGIKNTASISIYPAREK